MMSAIEHVCEADYCWRTISKKRSRCSYRGARVTSRRRKAYIRDRLWSSSSQFIWWLSSSRWTNYNVVFAFRKRTRIAPLVVKCTGRWARGYILSIHVSLFSLVTHWIGLIKINYFPRKRWIIRTCMRSWNANLIEKKINFFSLKFSSFNIDFSIFMCGRSSLYRTQILLFNRL